ncbi:MAG: hypothetical protein GWN14_02535, partial [candidate division Zixibacteria bacterium]|nr:hypothetical protein [Gammaproteobacteria bacterium]NIX54822.1 hypothetical protein [candidate division Zixibacteria bacterium]
MVIDDDPTTATAKMTERGLRVRDVNAHPFGISANRISSYLSDLGYSSTVEDADLTDPANWNNYDLIISSSGINETTLSNSTYRNALVAYSQNGGQFIIEGGEVGWDWRNDPPVMDYLLHSDDWNDDNAGPINLIGGLSNHPMVNEPNVLPSTISITFTAYGSEDAMSATDSYVLYETTDYPGYGGISIYDDNANPISAQSVYYALNFAEITDTTVAKQLLENTMNYLLTPETTNQAPIVIHPLKDIMMMAEDDPDLMVADLDTVFLDPDGDQLNFSASSSDTSVSASIDNDHIMSISLASNWFGSATLWITGSDNAASVTDTIKVVVTAVNDAPYTFSLLIPQDGDSVDAFHNPINFVWNQPRDIENDTLTYEVILYSANLDTSFADIPDTSFTIDGSGFLENNRTYQWTTLVSDGELTTASPDTFSFVVVDSITGIADMMK